MVFKAVGLAFFWELNIDREKVRGLGSKGNQHL